MPTSICFPVLFFSEAFFLKKFGNTILALTFAESTAQEGEYFLLFLIFHVDSHYSFKDIMIFVQCVGSA